MWGLILAISLVGQGRYSIQPEDPPTRQRYTVVQTAKVTTHDQGRILEAIVEAKRQAAIQESTRKDVVVTVAEPPRAQMAPPVYRAQPVTNHSPIYFQTPVQYTYPVRTVYGVSAQPRPLFRLFQGGGRAGNCAGGVCY